MAQEPILANSLCYRAYELRICIYILTGFKKKKKNM